MPWGGTHSWLTHLYISNNIISSYASQVFKEWLLVAPVFSSRFLGVLFRWRSLPLATLHSSFRCQPNTFPAYLSRAIHATTQGNEKTNGACHDQRGPYRLKNTCLSKPVCWACAEQGGMNGSAVIFPIVEHHWHAKGKRSYRWHTFLQRERGGGVRWSQQQSIRTLAWILLIVMRFLMCLNFHPPC